tara:strand:+ start:431 stop:1024 length:594 start_codon:yes stop_codon:yes gene_type:complete
MINIIDGFYEPNHLGLIVLNFVNLHFESKHQPFERYFGGDRKLGYPVYETAKLVKGGDLAPYNIFAETWEKKSKIKPLYINTFFRKTKLSELKESPSWKQYKPHCDQEYFDIAGLLYFNSSFLKDGTYIFNAKHDYEPTVIVGSKYNRCVWYNPSLPHSPTMEQKVEERWTQPFFIIHKEETLKKYLNEVGIKKHEA